MKFSPYTLARSWALAPLALALAACALGPDGTVPASPQPEHYGVQPQPAQTVPARGVAQQFEVGARPVPQWWKSYGSDALDALVAEGLANSPDLASANERLSAAREQLKAQIADNLMPSLDAGADASRGRRLTLPMSGSPTALYNLFVGQLQAQYTFDLFGAARYANASLASRVDQQAFQLDAARRALAANIVTGAIDAASLRAQIAATERLVALAEQDARDMRRRHELGAVPQADSLDARRSAAALAASLPAMRAQWQATRHALAVLLGRTPDQAPDDLDFAQLATPVHVPVVVSSELLASRPDIQAAEAAFKAAAADVGVATAQMYPSLSLSATMGKGGFDWSQTLSGVGNIWTVGASLSMPLFHGGALRAQHRAAIDNYEAAASEYRQTVLAAFRNVADLLARLEQDGHALLAADTARDAAGQAYADARRRMELGAIAPAAARGREQQYLNAQVNALMYASARLTDTAALFQAMGSPAQPAEAPQVAAGR